MTDPAKNGTTAQGKMLSDGHSSASTPTPKRKMKRAHQTTPSLVDSAFQLKRQAKLATRSYDDLTTLGPHRISKRSSTERFLTLPIVPEPLEYLINDSFLDPANSSSEARPLDLRVAVNDHREYECGAGAPREPEYGHFDADRGQLPPDRFLLGFPKAVVTLFKTILGPSMLFLPAGFKNAGLATATCLTMLMGALTTYTLCCLLTVADELDARGVAWNGFGDVAQLLFGRKGKAAVDIALVTCQIGFCTAYCVFIPENIQAAIFEISDCDLSGVWASDSLVYLLIVMVIPLVIPLTWCRQLKYFGLTNMLGNVIVVVTGIYLMACNFTHIADDGAGTISNFKVSGFMSFIGTSLYMFEGGATMILPIRRSMKHPSQTKSVLIVTMVLCVVLQLTFAFTTVWVFGEKTNSIATLNYRDSTYALGGIVFVEMVQLGWAIAVFFTFPLQIFPAAQILERLCGWKDRKSGRKWSKNLLRTGMVLLCMTIALGGYSSVDNLVSLIGAIGCVPLAIIYPALCYWKMTTMPGGTKEGTVLTKELGIACFGLLGSVVAITSALKDWIQNGASDPQKCLST